jgi:hypothetical protein
MSSGVKISSTQVAFLTTRNINFGFQGWERPPAFTQYAKDVLCSSSDEFRARYGELYVIG